MEMQLIQCDNLGMSRDTSISASGRGQDGITTAFENHNIRILAVNDNTKFAVTNEKSTVHSKDTNNFNITLMGDFMGWCKLNKYIVIFTRNPHNLANTPDNIYRLELTGDNKFDVVLLYHGNLGFNPNNAIEAIGYYESEEVQKVYWVDGLNPNRFINIVADSNTRANWEDTSFDFQGHVDYIPNVTVEKNLLKAGHFLAGTMQYFITYYNKYGVETCIVWNSDLQYVSLSDRGAKADEPVSCGFDFKITNLDTSYDYLRIYSCYRSNINSVSEANIVTEISLTGVDKDTVLTFTDLGSNKEAYNSQDLYYVGGQDLRANTLDYKQDTMFFGDIKLPNNTTIDIDNFIKFDKELVDVHDEDGKNVFIKESKGINWIYKKAGNEDLQGLYAYESQLKNSQEEIAGFKWREVYRFGIQFMTFTGEWTSAYWLGDKYCDCPPVKLTDDNLVVFSTDTITVTRNDDLNNVTICKYNGTITKGVTVYDSWINKDNSITYLTIVGSPVQVDDIVFDIAENEIGTITALKENAPFNVKIDPNGTTIDLLLKDGNPPTTRTIVAQYTGEGHYVAQATLDLTKVCTHKQYKELQSKFLGYRLLMADMDITNRRIVEQGVLNPTMFNYADRYHNRPYSIPSWMFRPRTALNVSSAPINRHYDTMPKQTANNAELQGIMEKLVPGFDVSAYDKEYNAFVLVLGANDGGSYVKWKLIYYNAGKTDEEKFENAKKILDVDKDGNPTYTAVYGDNYKVVSSGYIKKVAGKWSSVHGGMIDEITRDVQDKGLDVVLSPAMLPTADMLKAIAFQKGDAAAIFAIIGAVIIALASAVAAVFTGGAALLAGAAAIASLTAATATTAVITSAVASIAAVGAIAAGAGAAAIATQMDNFKKIDRQMAAKGFLPINMDGHELSKRQDTPHIISDTFKRMFTVKDSSATYAELIDDPTPPFNRDPSTVHGALGMDYNAYIMSGTLSFLNAEEEDLKNKQCVFASDESIVTMNAPDIEENTYVVDNSEALDLDLIGMIPVQAVCGEYEMQTTVGLNNSAQVMPDRFVHNALFTSNILGMVNGNIYQDFAPDSKMLASYFDNNRKDKIQVGASTSLFKQWMWNRETSASMWMPGVTLLSPIDEEPITEPAARINHKLFANMRFSPYTMYAKPFKMDIESPVVCLDNQTMIKPFKFNGDTKYYYEAVNTISTYNHPYALVVNNELLPDNEAMNDGKKDHDYLQQCALTDPVHIKYRQTPHILIPFKAEENVHTILPYTSDEESISPVKMYGEELKDIKLAGISPKIEAPKYEELDSVYESIYTKWSDINTTPELVREKSVDQRKIDEAAMSYCIDIFKSANDIYNAVFKYLDKETIIQYLLGDYNTIATDGRRVLNKTLPIEIYPKPGESIKDYKKQYLFFKEGYYYKLYNEVISTLNGSKYEIKWYVARLLYIPIDITEHTEFVVDTEFTTCVYENVPTFFNYSSTTNVIVLSNTNSFVNIDKNEDGSSKISTKYANHDSKSIFVNEGHELPEEKEYYSNTFTGSTWKQAQIKDWVSGNTPYLFMGELVKKVFDYNTWMGGTEEFGLKQIHWNVASKVTPIEENIYHSWGDTFYQRWDCQKTYPYTEEDKNSVVDVLSFMLESHTNLDGRCDVNRGIGNLRNLRPTNTLFNPAYSQKDNFFSYQLLDKKFDKKHFEADVLWSLTKNNVDDIDKWTCLTSANEMSLDGKHGTIRKILNVNDNLYAFQDSAISGIRYNEQAALATTSGLPVQLGNSHKVDGYRIVTDTTGCHNKWSINKNSAGVYFVDDYNKSFNVFSPNEGASNIGINADFSMWFKKHIDGDIWSVTNPKPFRTSYDEVNHDLYIINDTTCLVYNTLLKKFTSFFDYIDTPVIANVNNGIYSGVFAFRQSHNTLFTDTVDIHKLFAGVKYGNIYGKFRPYSMEYRISPDPLHDSIFTNYSYSADWTDPTKEVDEDHLFDSTGRRYTTFDSVEAKNEYQRGITAITTARMGSHPIKAKFRLWRGDIPRDGYSLSGIQLKADRMRNPWIHLKFEKFKEDDSKMTFHNLMVNYYNQYGRF